jgi:hypothetical protein
MPGNEVEIVVTSRDESAKVLGRLPDHAQKAGKEAGSKLSKAVAEQTRRMPSEAGKTGKQSGEKLGEEYTDAARSRVRKGASSITSSVGRSLRRTSASAGRAGRAAGKSLTSGLLGIVGGGALAGGLAGIGVAAGAALVGGITKSLETADLAATARASLGLSAADSSEIGQVAGDAFAKGYAGSMGEAIDAVEAIRSSLGDWADEDAMPRLTRDALNFAKVFGGEVSDSVSVVQNLIRNGIAKDGVEAFDLLTRAAQRTPKALRGEVGEAAEEYAQFFRQLGFTGPEMFDLLVRGARKGRYGIDKAGDSIKEFTVRAIDGSKSTENAFKDLGFESDDMARKFLAGGDKANKAFDQTVKALLKIKDPAKQARLALALFGTPLEDLSTAEIPDFLKSMDDLGSRMGNTKGAADRMNDALDTNARKLTAWKNSATKALTEFGDRAVGAFAEFAESEDVQNFIDTLRREVVPAVREIAGWIGEHLIPRIRELAQEWLRQGAEAFGKLRQATADYKPEIRQVLGWFRRLAEFMTDKLIPTMGPFLANGLGTGIKALAKITRYIGFAVRAFNALRSGSAWLRRTAVASLNAIGNAAGRLRGRVARAAYGMFSPIVDAFRRSMNWIISRWNNFSIPGISTPLGTIGGVSTPNLRYFASGGITSGGLSAMNDRELVRLPSGSMVYPAGQSQAMAAAVGGGGPVQVVVSAAPGSDSRLVAAIMEMLRFEVRRGGGVTRTLEA